MPPPRAIPMSSLALALSIGGCSEPPSPDAVGPKPDVYLAGCADVQPGPVCVRPVAPVRVWLDAPVDQVTATPAMQAVAADTGTRLVLSARTPVTLTVHKRAPVTIRFSDAAAGAGRALHTRGKRANRDGRMQDAVGLLTQAAEQQVRDGDRSGAAVSAQILAFIHRERNALSAARKALTQWAPLPADGSATATHAFFRGLIAYAGANPREALRAFDVADRWTRRLDLPLGGVIQQQKAAVYTDLGRIDDALTTLAQAEAQASALPPCARGDLLTNLGWVLLASPQATTERTGRVLNGARSAYADCASTSATKRANAQVNYGIWTLRAGRPIAEFALDASVDPEVRAWGRYIAAHRVSIAARADALIGIARLAEDAGFSRLQWQALVDAGIAFEAVDANAAAIRAYTDAEAVVAAGAFAIPADAGRSAFAADRRESAQRLVAALHGAGEIDAAMAAARRARRRVLTTLPPAITVDQLTPPQRAQWEKAWAEWRTARAALAQSAARDWELTGPALVAARQARVAQRNRVRALLDRALLQLTQRANAAAPLSAPAPDEAIVIWSATPDDGWTVFLADADGTTAAKVRPPAWTAPIRDRLARAKRIRVLAAGPLINAPLDLAGRPAVYALDLPPRAQRPAAKTAALVADPTGDLPGARAEATQVRPGLRRVVADPTVLSGAQTTVAALIRQLEEVDHLHYAGHGRYAGFEGWQSALPVRDGALEIGDLFALRRVPSTVVLSGCETGKAGGEQAIGVGLAHAFLLRGAQTVIAPIRQVDDGQAARFGVALYATRAQKKSWAEALQSGVRAAGADAYRLFVP